VVARVSGEYVIDVCRTLAMNPSVAPPGTIRGALGLVISEKVVHHGSDSPQSAGGGLERSFG
jgi:nucleoside diphosphate kinase